MRGGIVFSGTWNDAAGRGIGESAAGERLPAALRHTPLVRRRASRRFRGSVRKIAYNRRMRGIARQRHDQRGE